MCNDQSQSREGATDELDMSVHDRSGCCTSTLKVSVAGLSGPCGPKGLNKLQFLGPFAR